MSNFSFNDVPVLRHSRSRFDLSHNVKTSGNVGTLYPFEVQEVYGGDTFKIKTSFVSRLSSQFIKPVMDNLFLDVYYFFVPSRLLYDRFVNIFGENTESAWVNTTDYEVPVMSNVIVPSKSVGDYLGLPVGVALDEVNILPFRAFAKIYNEWFRDQNNISPMHVQTGEIAASESPNSNAWAPNNYFGALPKVAKFHDYFTSCLPSPQKGDPAEISLGDLCNVPVITTDSAVVKGSHPVMRMTRNVQGTAPTPGAGLVISNTGGLDEALNATGQGTALQGLYPNNLVAQTENLAFNPITVNDLRFAFQYQKMLERDARSGSRYVEYLASHFGVQAGDYRLQRSEFLGGRRIPINIQQVVQSTGSGNDESPLGQVGAYSLTNGNTRFTKSFTENGYVIGVYCIRQHHTYQQGVEKFWTRKKRTDFFDPVFSHIGEQPVMASELYAGAPSGQVFGYNEAWADLRARPNRVCGQMRTVASDSLDVWHFADFYTSVPTLNEQFINETPEYVNRGIVVESSEQDQFILDFWVNNVAYRVLPTYSVPSLIDHD